jgi:lysophospholipase L1-like esterase
MSFKIKVTRKIMPSSLDGKAYKSTPQTNQWIVIHNTAGGTASSNANYFHSGSEGRNVCAHYVVDDQEIYQLLEDNWYGVHAGGDGQEYKDKWTPSNATDCTNSNSIGIEVADGDKVNHLEAIENVIELTRYLMKQYNIDANHVIRHGDTQAKGCPATIMKLGKWGYIKEEIAKRNEANQTLTFDKSLFSTSSMNGSSASSPTGSGGSGSGSSSDSALDILPNVDHRFNIANMEEVTGACLIFNPPFNVCTLENKEKHFAEWLWDKSYHYLIDPTYIVDDNPNDDIPDLTNAKHINDMDTDDGTDQNTKPGAKKPAIPDDDINPDEPKDPNDENSDDNQTPDVVAPEEDNSIVIKGGFLKDKSRLLQCYSLTDNDKITYINRTLFENKPQAHCIMIGCFIPYYDDLKDLGITYEQVEKNIINSVSKILWANGLEAKNLWREFDLNRVASPAHYLERNKWKDLLNEIDKQVEWRNAKFGVVTPTYKKYIAVIPDQTIQINTGTGSNTGDTSSPDISGISDTAKAVWTFLTSKGYTPECAAGILGNMYQESGVNPKAIQGGGKGPAAGICQWENYNTKSARWKAMADHASSKGKDWTDLQSQLEWLDLELQGKDSTTLSHLKKKVGGYEQFKALTDVDKACLVFEESFERAGKPNMPRRYEAAKKYYEQFKGSTSTTSVASIQPRSPEQPDDNGNSNTTTSSSLFTEEDFKNAVFVGDSLTVGMGQAVKNVKVFATVGQTVGKGKGEHFNSIVQTKPKIVVLSYGTNDSGYKDTTGFVTNYKGFISDLKSKIPGVTVFVNKIFPGDPELANESGKKCIENIPAHNDAIGTIVAEAGAFLLDCTTIPNLKSYYTDGIHFKNEFYKLWYDKMKELVLSTSTNSGGSETTTTGSLINSIWGEIKNPGPAVALPYNGNSMGGLEHKEWGGRMDYYINDPQNQNMQKPTINNIVSDNEYYDFCKEFFLGEKYDSNGIAVDVCNFQKYWELIDLYSEEHEPYDKGLVDIKVSGITPNDRINALTTTFTTDNENIFHFNVLESGPGSTGHCVKAADELNYIITPTDLKVEPIYPDLILPPQYTTTGNDKSNNNAIPLSVMQQVKDSDTFTKQLSFDYDLLKDKVKKTDESLGPINFMDPYPTDDKIIELERHFPKVSIDEIEAQLYSCNHPGCPIGQPMAKNFAMLSDALMNQAQRTEQRLVKLENILSTIMRNQARLSSRININCVYYGGQSTLAGKYKCIRCMHDDRVHDGAIVTLDQCLNCTRYEPILGQIYQILDESGFNGSVILDDMQMSYSNLENYKQLNMQTMRSVKYNYVEANGEKNCIKPEKDRIELWKEANKQIYLKQKEQEALEKEIEDDITSDEINEEVEAAIEPEYIFRMNWADTFLNSQQPDVKAYPTEGIIMRYKKETGDLPYNEYLKTLDPELDKDVIEDVQKEMKLVNGLWVSTQEEPDTVQVNKYSSEKFYFKGFAEIKQSSWNSSGPGGGNGVAECRQKILEMANTIVQECTDGKAWYSQTNRTTDYNKPGYHNGKKAYDCTGFVSCCYLHAGLKSMYAKTCSGGTLINEIINNGGEMWLMNEEGFNKAKPGDVIIVANSKVSESDMGKFVKTQHAIIYMGDKTIAHAANSKKGIIKESIEDWRMKAGTHFFVRPKDLMDADAASVSAGGSSGGVNETAGEVDGKKYVARIPGAVCTSYTGGGSGASGMGCEYNKTCASHNMPYGTKIYIPQLASKLGGDGVLTVTDTGGCFFDFDLFTQSSIGKTNADVYVLEWGTGKVAPSYTWAINFYLGNGRWSGLISAWNTYKNMGGKLMSFTKFNQEDANLKNHAHYNDK